MRVIHPFYATSATSQHSHIYHIPWASFRHQAIPQKGNRGMSTLFHWWVLLYILSSLNKLPLDKTRKQWLNSVFHNYSRNTPGHVFIHDLSPNQPPNELANKQVWNSIIKTPRLTSLLMMRGRMWVKRNLSHYLTLVACWEFPNMILLRDPRIAQHNFPSNQPLTRGPGNTWLLKIVQWENY